MQIDQIIEKHGTTPDKLIAIMLECQECSEESYLLSSDITSIAKLMNLPESQVYSVASFYSLLSTKPRGKFIIQICNDVPCYINGSMNLVTELETMLQIKMGETTKDKLFTLEFTSCLGCCEIAPVMQIGAKVFGNLTSKKLVKILDEFRGN